MTALEVVDAPVHLIDTLGIETGLLELTVHIRSEDETAFLLRRPSPQDFEAGVVARRGGGRRAMECAPLPIGQCRAASDWEMKATRLPQPTQSDVNVKIKAVGKAHF